MREIGIVPSYEIGQVTPDLNADVCMKTKPCMGRDDLKHFGFVLIEDVTVLWAYLYVIQRDLPHDGLDARLVDQIFERIECTHPRIGAE
jgi:hypothetical protein